MKTYEEGFIAGFSHNIKTVEKLEERIKKAVDEIKYFELQADHLDDNIYLDKTLSNKLLEILKGNEK